MFSTVFAKTLRDQRRGLIGWSIGIALTVLLMAAIWPSFSDVDFESIMDQYPEAMKEIFNVTDMGTATGYMNAELFSLVVPMLFIIFGVGRAARLVGGEEEDGTLEILAAMPVSRPRMLLDKAGALIVSLLVLTVVLFVSTWLGSVAFSMDIPVGDIVNAAIAMFLLGVEFALITLAVSAITGKRSLSMGVGAALAAASYLVFLIGQLVDTFEPLLKFSPFYQAISEGPLGPDLPLIVAAMPLVGLVVLGISVPLFARRDLAV